MQRAFLLRSCSDAVYASRTRPCLQYQIKRCSAPCVGRISEPEYGRLVDEAGDFLSGHSREVQDRLAEEMQAASDALEFERAARLRDRVRALAHIQSHQGVNVAGLDEADIIAAHQAGGQTCVQVFFFRGGSNYGNRAYFPSHDREMELPQVLSSFIGQFYDNKEPPKLVLVSHTPLESALLQEALSVKAGRKVELIAPRQGGKRKLIDQALVNAREALERRLAENATQRQLLEGVAQCFGLESAPQRIEVYDNSHISGRNAYGAMIVAGPEGFQKNAYRKFSIDPEGLTPGDDYAMMRQVLTRRFSRALKEDPERDKGTWPDLVLVDGGAGQLGVALEVFAESRRHRCGAGGRRQGTGPRCRARALLHARAGALRPRAAGSRALFPAAPAGRGAPVCHWRPSQQAVGADLPVAAGRDPGHRRQAEEGPAAPLRIGQGGGAGGVGRPSDGGRYQRRRCQEDL